MSSNQSLREKVDAIDHHGFVGMLHNAVEHFEGSFSTANNTDLSSLDVAKVNNIVILGMGGSGSTGDIINAAFEDELDVPVTVVKSYDIPNFIGEKSLVFATSYSGNTEETVSATKQALAKNAQVVFISSGGILKDLATENDCIHIPLVGGLQPRAAFATLFPVITSVLNNLGLISFSDAQAESLKVLLAKRFEVFSPENESESNVAYEIAKQVQNQTVLLYGGDTLGGTATYRVKCDFNENAKVHSFSHSYPELDHNEICAWDEKVVDYNSTFIVLELRNSYESERTKLRFDITKKIIDGAEVLSYTAQGDSKLEQLVDTIYFGLWCSSYLAILNDTDPGYIKNIVNLKEELSKA